MRMVGIKEARRRFSLIIQWVERGETVVLTRRGKSVARIVPMEGQGAGRLPDLTDFRASIKPKGRTLSGTIVALRKGCRY